MKSQYVLLSVFAAVAGMLISTCSFAFSLTDITLCSTMLPNKSVFVKITGGGPLNQPQVGVNNGCGGTETFINVPANGNYTQVGLAYAEGVAIDVKLMQGGPIKAHCEFTAPAGVTFTNICIPVTISGLLNLTVTCGTAVWSGGSC